MLRRLLFLFAVLLVAPGVVATAADAATHTPTQVAVPGGLTPSGKVLRVDSAGHIQAVKPPRDCGTNSVVCKPERSGSCTGYASQSTPPTKIRVLTGSTVASIRTVDFKTYVQDTLPNEWPATWDGDSVRAGAVAVKTYAWYWVTHYGGYVGSSPSADNCFDVTDDVDFQVYVAGSAAPQSNVQIDKTWPVAVRRNGQLVLTQYKAGLVDPNYEKPDTVCGAGRDGTQLSQSGSEVCNMSNHYNNPWRYNVILKLYYGNDIDLSSTAQLRTPQDFTYQRKTTPTGYNAGNWLVADGYPTSFPFGGKGDVPFTATTGDGFATAAVWRPSNTTFYVADAVHRGASTVRFGLASDIPVAAHYQGLDAPTRLAVWRPNNGTWYLAPARGAGQEQVRFGLKSDVPVPGRWTSTTTDSIAVWRPNNGSWYLPGQTAVQFGHKGDVPAPADYNGDGRTNFAVYRPSNNTFYLRGGPTVAYGLRGDVPVSGDFTGDGRADLAVYRPSNRTLYVRGGAQTMIGAGTPVGAAPARG